MFLDGPRNKGNLIINHVNLWFCKDEQEGDTSGNTEGSTPTNGLLSKIGSKLGANELPRGLFGHSASNGAANRQQQQRSNKSLATKLSLLRRSQSIVRNSTGRGLRSRGNSVAATSIQKVAAATTTTSPLRRTSSLSAARNKIKEKSAFIKFHEHQQPASVVKLLEVNKRLGCAISNRVAKFEAWLTVHLSLVSILASLLLLLVGPTSSLGAPVPRAVLQPIWMDDGLISLDSPQAIDDPAQDLEPPGPSGGGPNDRWLVQLKVLDPEELGLSLGPSQPTPGLGGAYEAQLSEVNEADEEASSLPVQLDEQVRLERRRLDRNRALEPPPWLRMQPMRRDGASASLSVGSDQQESVESSPGQRQSEYDEESGDLRAPRGRQSRESTERAYQELIGQLLEQALGTGPLVGDLYDELELRYQAAGDPKPLAASNKLAVVGSVGSSGQAQDLTNPPSDATLVIVGDEVSSDDDVVSAANPMASASSSIPQRLVDEPATMDETTIELGAGKTASPSNGGIKSAAYMAAPTEPQLAGLRLVSMGDQQEQPATQQQPQMIGDYLQLNPNNGQSSFHVVEDIDQVDGGQDAPLQQQQQQQQTMSLVGAGDIDEPVFGADSSYPAKRSSKFGRTSRGRQAVSRWQSPDIDVSSSSSSNSREQLAIMMIERGLFSEAQLVEAANKLRRHLAGLIGLPEATIIGLYPIGERDLLIKLDSSSLNNLQRANLIKNYHFVRGYIVKSWPRNGHQQNPVPLLTAIMRVLSLDGSPPRPDSNVEFAQLMLPLDGVGARDDDDDDVDADERPRPKMLPYQQLQQHQKLANSYPSWPVADLRNDQSVAAIMGYLAAASRPPAAPTEVVEEAGKWPSLESGFYIQLAALVIALLVALMLLKLVTRPHCKRRDQIKRRIRSLWSTTSGREESQLVGDVAGEAKALEAGELPPPAYMSPKDYSAKQFGLLTQRLVQLVNRQSGADSESKVEHKDASKSQELDEASTSDCNPNEPSQTLNATSDTEDSADNCTQNGGGEGRFRSSRSYIRSLIEVLTKSKVAQVVTSSPQQTSREQQVDSNELDQVAKQVQVDASANVVSQMDISAAHLILDYMEKHLEDKERLRREWLELNAGSEQQQWQQSRQSKPKSSQHKLGLGEENMTKNRSNPVEPLNRNRVRLGVKHGAGESEAPSRTSKQDYINASYIYDDDLRRPTHIIAQGPLDEQAAGQFWQMVWEQGVSVVVALTRLNENSIRMCHCYWPTATTRQELLAKDDAVSGPKGVVSSAATPLESPNGDSNERRASVTSVLNSNAAGGPSVGANGDNQNNILTFQLNCGGNETLKLEVHLVSEHVSSQDYLVRNMYLVNRTSGETRTITQFHYLAWPETGVPTNVKSFLEFRRKVHKSYRNLSSPILVHCSDGGGRSGTYTLIDIILERIKNGAKEIDPRATLEHLRDQRAGLCASQGQFEFVLVALAEEIQIILNALPH